MAVTYQKEQKKFSFFFKISMIFLLLGIVLNIFGLKFWGELSCFACCTVMLVGIEYIILHHITYFTSKKIERVISVLFYTGIVCFVLRLFAALIFKEDYYAGISPFMEVHGFYYLMGDIARLHSAIISYARDYMIDKGFTYCIPPFMIRSNVVTGVMSFAEMDAMMYKIEGEDLYLIGTSEHSMIGKFIDTITEEKELPKTLTSYSPCFRKEKGAHGIEERGVYRIHQFEKQEMIVVCKPEESPMWFDNLWKNTVGLFRSLDIPVRTLECCSGDLADLKIKSIDVEAWSPRQKKYFEVGSCSNLGDAQARRLQIRIRKEDGSKYFAHTLNNTVVAPPRMLIAFLENNLREDGSVHIPEVLRPYMGGKEFLGKPDTL